MTVFGRLGGRLRAALADEATPIDRGAEMPAGVAVAPQEIEFAAYAEDCRLFGFYRLAAPRLTDVLNDAEAYDLTDVLVVRLDTGASTQTSHLTVRREE